MNRQLDEAPKMNQLAAFLRTLINQTAFTAQEKRDLHIKLDAELNSPDPKATDQYQYFKLRLFSTSHHSPFFLEGIKSFENGRTDQDLANISKGTVFSNHMRSIEKEPEQ